MFPLMLGVQLLLCQDRLGIWPLLYWCQCAVTWMGLGYDDSAPMMQYPNRLGPKICLICSYLIQVKHKAVSRIDELRQSKSSANASPLKSFKMWHLSDQQNF